MGLNAGDQDCVRPSRVSSCVITDPGVAEELETNCQFCFSKAIEPTPGPIARDPEVTYSRLDTVISRYPLSGNPKVLLFTHLMKRPERPADARVAVLDTQQAGDSRRLPVPIQPGVGREVRADLRDRFPGRLFRVYPGDCNETIDRVLADLGPWKWAPTFAFADQHAAEIRWDTPRKVAEFRTGPRKAEIWLLTSPAETVPRRGGIQRRGICRPGGCAVRK
jgi:hypothetical protein